VKTGGENLDGGRFGENHASVGGDGVGVRNRAHSCQDLDCKKGRTYRKNGLKQRSLFRKVPVESKLPLGVLTDEIPFTKERACVGAQHRISFGGQYLLP